MPSLDGGPMQVSTRRVSTGMMRREVPERRLLGLQVSAPGAVVPVSGRSFPGPAGSR
jgi:hypothetical protein